ncbi:2-oxo acid dehydrogenase subunit E2 [Nocardia sp. ET3-3]|uniref:Dihydrolipoamide acetyltransferase component of pyruvate dehydrogenase complex n=1 Tax=Nocardia terrae TaxID=2675851 RepID=A0A7K1UVH8_9NOCA|nr:2-oxo acid dehydrogenase subunit E2 [Nocardia terrae]
MPEFRMPSLGADMTEGTLLEWRVRPGDAVHQGDVVAEVDTTKAAIEVECFDDGVIGEILVPEGATVPVGTPLATIETAATSGPDGSSPAVAATPEPESAPAPPVASERPVTPAAPVAAEHEQVEHEHDGHESAFRATPLVRRLAAEAGIDLATVHGSAPGGRIVRADVDRAVVERRDGHRAHVRATGYARRLASEAEVDLTGIAGTGPGGAVRAVDVRAAASQRGEAPAVQRESARPVPASPESASAPIPPAARQPLAPQHDPAEVRKLIAAAMTRSKRTVPHYYLSSTIDMTAAQRWLTEYNRRVPVTERMLPAALLLAATARAARAVPELNGHWIDDEFRAATAVHLGVVVSMRAGGIIVPTIPDADRLALPELMAAMRGVAERARAVRLRSSDATPATITVTNLGDLGVDSVYGVIAAPQVAIVGFGAVTERPCAVDGLLGVRPQLTATLSADHRATDGAIGARFLHILADLLQTPEEL